MATTKVKKPAAKKSVTAKVMTKPAVRKKPTVVKKAATVTVKRRRLISRSEEYTNLTWILIGIWLVLIAIFVGTVLGRSA